MVASKDWKSVAPGIWPRWLLIFEVTISFLKLCTYSKVKKNKISDSVQSHDTPNSLKSSLQIYVKMLLVQAFRKEDSELYVSHGSFLILNH